MSLTRSQYDAVMRLYDRRQIEDHRIMEERRRKAYAVIPELASIDAGVADAAVRRLRGLFGLEPKETVDAGSPVQSGSAPSIRVHKVQGAGRIRCADTGRRFSASGLRGCGSSCLPGSHVPGGSEAVAPEPARFSGGLSGSGLAVPGLPRYRLRRTEAVPLLPPGSCESFLHAVRSVGCPSKGKL